MTRTFAVKTASLAALLGFILVAILSAVGYALVSTIRAANVTLSTYADELVLAWSLQEAYERKLASGRGFLIARDDSSKREFDSAAADGERVLAALHKRVESKEGIALLDASERRLREHDLALRDVMAMDASLEVRSQRWATNVRARALRAREAMDAFIQHKTRLVAHQRAQLARAQSRAAWVMAGSAIAAMLLGFFGGRRLLRGAKQTYAAESAARAAAEHERLFFYSLIDQLPVGIVAADASGRIMHVSRFARKMLAVSDLPWATADRDPYAKSPAYRSDGSHYEMDDLPLVRALRGEVVAQAEVRSTSQRVYSVTAGPVRDQSGTLIAAILAIIDITDRKRGEKERELFIGALGHDLRNPLHAISLAAELLARRSDVPDAAKIPATRIASSALRMNQLISDLLDFARSQHAAIPIKPATCELREIAADVIAEFKLAEPDVDIRVEPQSGCEGQWDRARMAQVFQNLIGNAIQHGVPDTPITVQIGCDAERVWARVENRGTLATDERHRIFEPFRSHPSSKGLGLGLYIARAIVEAHGGTIAVDSNAEWTSFLVTLPLHAKPQPKTHRSSEFRPLA